MTNKIIGLAGFISVGKTACAMGLIRRGFVRVRFADPLKNMLLSLGLTREEIDGALREQPCNMLCGRTPRHAMQTLGTEWGRTMIGPGLWVNAWRAQVLDVARVSPVVCDDVRFVNEVAAIHDLGGGVVVRVTRQGVEASTHTSEAQDFKTDYTISNDGTVDELVDKVGALL